MIRSTTILSVRRDGAVAIGGDGQVTLDNAVVVKSDAVKIRRLYEDRVIVGFAGAAADAFALMQRFEDKLKEFGGNVMRSAYELAREWRTDRALRQLQSLLAVVDRNVSLILSGSGEVIEPSDGIIGIGTGGPFAMAAARALLKHTKLTAREIVVEALKIASEICVYTNDKIRVEELR